MTAEAKEAPAIAETRPALLNPLFAPLAGVKGVGKQREPQLAAMLGRDEPRVLDLVWLQPSGSIPLSPTTDASLLVAGATLTLSLVVEAPPLKGVNGAPTRILCRSCGQTVELVYFGPLRVAQTERFQQGAAVLVHGRLSTNSDRLQMPHPRLLDDVPEPSTRSSLPIYSSARGLVQGTLRRIVDGAFARLSDLPEWIEPRLAEKMSWPGWLPALGVIHQRDGADSPRPHLARRRLAYDELLAGQLALELSRQRQAGPGVAPRLEGKGELRRPLLHALPYTPTGAQQRATAAIDDAMASEQPMRRLLQGDVGSGKTFVALMAMLAAAEAGWQAALMAPTEMLAQQHAATIEDLVRPLGLDVALLIGSGPAAGRRTTEGLVARGAVKLVVGTHALFQAGIAFAALGLVVIDEQHRFGVHQRLALRAKGGTPHMLLMTATPIPRSLVLCHYGDVDVTFLDEKPAGRLPIATRVVSSDRMDEVVAACRRAVERDERVYWVCPAIDGNEATDTAAATERHAKLREELGEIVGLAHGRMDTASREAALAAFVTGKQPLLVATTIVEVGIDVPEATLIVIEQAHRFGLAQLHQLRGRVGRGANASLCLLVYDPPLTATSRARLAILRETEDGFRIADEDLRLRGPGEILGTRQSGAPAFRFVDPDRDADLIPLARDDARLALRLDPSLTGGRGRSLQILLHLHERHATIPTLSAG